MCVAFTKYFRCGCTEPNKAEGPDGCGGRCTGDNIRYDGTRDHTVDGTCKEHVYLTPPSSSDSSVSDGGEESAAKERNGRTCAN